ncbi:hypothetical protein [Desulfospira joergensenii]|uniref:hypothetical protein n=1 Tax=Desulfospira joergensenii TaxID=53329 RepID=UPI0003B64E4C|nr:hypothetical protein [Desulfospira joergensenii]
MEKQDKTSGKEALKVLRAQRKESIARALSRMKAQKKDINAITRFLEAGEATIPDIARGTDMPADKALWYMATLKKYGCIAEGPKDGAFFKYGLVPSSGSEKTVNKEKAEGAI